MTADEGNSKKSKNTGGESTTVAAIDSSPVNEDVPTSLGLMSPTTTTATSLNNTSEYKQDDMVLTENDELEISEAIGNLQDDLDVEMDDGMGYLCNPWNNPAFCP